jgi:hypothetical protein
MGFGKMSGGFVSQACILACLTDEDPILGKKHKWIDRVRRAKVCYRVICHSGLGDLLRRIRIDDNNG